MTLLLTPPRRLPVDDVALGPLRADLIDYGTPGIHLAPVRLRKRAPGQPPPPPIGAPRYTTRIWPYAIENTINARSTAVSPAFPAPGMIYEFMIDWHSPGGIVGAMSLLWSTEGSGAVTNGAETTIPSGDSVLLPTGYQMPGANNNAFNAFFAVFNDAVTAKTPAALRYIVPTTSPWYLKISVSSPVGGGPNSPRGYVVIVSAATFDDLSRLF